jgi:hypothetical protein
MIDMWCLIDCFVPCAGDLLIIGAQVVAASQMVLEEKFVSGLDIPALQAVGWEGKYLTVIFTSTECS